MGMLNARMARLKSSDIGRPGGMNAGLLRWTMSIHYHRGLRARARLSSMNPHSQLPRLVQHRSPNRSRNCARNNSSRRRRVKRSSSIRLNAICRKTDCWYTAHPDVYWPAHTWGCRVDPGP